MILKAIFLGIVQGLTEFLPVSSTGHLIVVEHWLGISQKIFGLSFDVALHLGTLLALGWYFSGEVKRLVEDDIRQIRAIGLLRRIEKLPRFFTTKVVVATVPAAVLGLLLESQIETVFRNPILIAWALIFFSLVIWWADRKIGETKEIGEIGLGKALVIGFFQSLALVPGISRSGATISGGMFLGLKRESAARFAFLLSIPIIFGASVKRIWEIWLVFGNLSPADFTFFFVGILTAALSSFLTIKFFLAYLKSARLWPFVVYRILLGFTLLRAF